jgi:hypothetical protein
MRMLLFFKINHNFNRKNQCYQFVQIIMMIKIKHDNAYINACMIKINVITFLNRLNHQIENAIRKKKKMNKKSD